MIRNNEEDEFVAVRVQDPRIQNEGSWNSYVDFKIFLHTNSKAFTAKTSCVRRRYSEFVWLKKQLQKNAGLVPVPDLPGKSFFSFSNEDFLERRRKGLQAFLDKVVHTTVCLSDSQLHLFLQTQLPVGHIQDCVQGHTPYSVTDAILTYASSNRGLVQAQDEDSIKEPSLTVSYESMESPAPHQPCLQTEETFSPELFSCSDPDPVEDLPELRDEDRVQKKSSIKISEKKNLLEAVIECVCEPAATFFLGNNEEDDESLSLTEETPQTSCQIQTPVEVHSSVEDCAVDSVFEENSSEREDDDNFVTLDTEEKTVHDAQTVVQSQMEETDQLNSPEATNIEKLKCVNSAVLDNESEEQGIGSDSRSQEEVLDNIHSEAQVLEKHVIAEVNCLERVDSAEGPAADVGCLKEPDRQKEPDNKSAGQEEMLLQSQILDETDYVNRVPEVQQMDQKQVEQDVDLVETKEQSEEDSQSLTSSNESIVKVSDEESVCDETEDSIQAADCYVKTVTHWSEVDAPSRNILDLQLNGYPEEKENISALEDEDMQYMTSLDLNSSIAGGDLNESGDFSVLESSRVPGLAVSKHTEQETVSLLSLDASEETHEVEVH